MLRRSLQHLLIALAFVLSSRSAIADTGATGNTPFAFELLSMLDDSGPDKRTIGNLVISPASIEAAFAVAGSGAGGDTAAELARAFHLQPGEDDRLVTDLAARLNEIQRAGGITVSMANGLWVAKRAEIRQGFIDHTKKAFGAEARGADFQAAAEKTRLEINGWVSEKTNGKITELLSKGLLDAATSLVIVNAFYFKADWQSAFEASSTTKGAFHTADGRTVDVPLMHEEQHLSYSETPEAQLLELPYRGGDVSMVIVLPKKTDGVFQLQRSLTAAAFQQMLGHASAVDVAISLPKFTMRSSFDLVETLQSLGVKRAFDAGAADFSGIAKARLFISHVVHQAYVAVDEKGTEAAAATAIIGADGAAPARSHPVLFTADHPFLFFLREERTGAILLMGRVAEPKLAE